MAVAFGDLNRVGTAPASARRFGRPANAGCCRAAQAIKNPGRIAMKKSIQEKTEDQDLENPEP